MSDTTQSALALPSQNSQSLDVASKVISSSTMRLTSTPDKLAFAKALLSAKSASENILNTEILVKDIVIQSTDMVNERTGVVEEVPRTIFVDAKGHAYYGFGVPLYRDTRTILGVFDGVLPPEGVTVTISKQGTGNSKYLTLDVK